jgi:endonuclease G
MVITAPTIGKRQGDRWYRDPRIDESEQLRQEAFETGIDRGHLTRREDTAWGRNFKDATAANNDTFHFTNCSLQASAFNRGKDCWQGFEQSLLSFQFGSGLGAEMSAPSMFVNKLIPVL